MLQAGRQRQPADGAVAHAGIRQVVEQARPVVGVAERLGLLRQVPQRELGKAQVEVVEQALRCRVLALEDPVLEAELEFRVGAIVRANGEEHRVVERQARAVAQVGRRRRGGACAGHRRDGNRGRLRGFASGPRGSGYRWRGRGGALARLGLPVQRDQHRCGVDAGRIQPHLAAQLRRQGRGVADGTVLAAAQVDHGGSGYLAPQYQPYRRLHFARRGDFQRIGDPVTARRAVGADHQRQRQRLVAVDHARRLQQCHAGVAGQGPGQRQGQAEGGDGAAGRHQPAGQGQSGHDAGHRGRGLIGARGIGKFGTRKAYHAVESGL
ncbi:hypothetical protein D9M68_622380 [compost metagenome]